MSTTEWYYADGNEQKGPVSSAELKALADGGNLESSDLVWCEGMEDWLPLAEVSDRLQPAVTAESVAEPSAPQGVPEPVRPTEPKPKASQAAAPGDKPKSAPKPAKKSSAGSAPKASPGKRAAKPAAKVASADRKNTAARPGSEAPGSSRKPVKASLTANDARDKEKPQPADGAVAPPTEGPAEAAIEWYYSRDDERQGPVSEEKLQKLAAAGKLDRDDLVWNEGFDDWIPAGDVPGLLPAAEHERASFSADLDRDLAAETASSSDLHTLADFGAEPDSDVLDEPIDDGLGDDWEQDELAAAVAAPPAAADFREQPELPDPRSMQPSGLPPTVVYSAPRPGPMLSAIQCAIWGLCLALVVSVMVMFLQEWKAAESAADRTSAAGYYFLLLAVGYVLARAGDRLVQLVDQFGRRE